MDPRDSVHVYPRVDEKYKIKHSLPFDMMQTKIFLDRYEPVSVAVYKWLVYFFIGFFTGAIAFVMSILEDWLIKSRNDII